VFPWALVAGTSIAMLAKGPVALVLAGLPMITWWAWVGRGLPARPRVAWAKAALVAVLLVLPWYLLAEWRSPGFLRYFVIGEHFERFLVPGWKGDLFGNAHRLPRGTIWLFGLAAVLPWPLVLPWLAARGSSGSAQSGWLQTALREPWPRYLLLWALAPLLLFTLAGNVVWTYVLPGLPAMALLAATWTASHAERRRVEYGLAAALGAMALAIPAWIWLGYQSGRFERKSAEWLVLEFERRAGAGQTLHTLGRLPPFSASFYTHGRVAATPDAAALAGDATAHGSYLAVLQREYSAWPQALRERFDALATRGGWMLLRLR
jgi:4-amino-4-deoxy-L-arabinose transferase-like glycosyltransferase